MLRLSVITFLLLFMLAASFAGEAIVAENTRAESIARAVDVRKDIWPIFRERCLHCHGPSRMDGDLRLDQKSSIDAGGHTGIPLLGTEETSELLRRVVSNEDNYRMPKGEYPLSFEQIDLIRGWIQAGATWPKDEGISVEEPVTLVTLRTWDFWTRRIDLIAKLNQEFQVLYVPCLLLLLAIAFFERRKRRRQSVHHDSKEQSFLDRIQKHFAMPQYLIGVLCFLLAGSIKHHLVTIETMKQKLAEIESESKQNGLLASQVERNRFQVPTPYRPKHPPRLGGKYYRGNDERSEKLFNGGYYRTANMDVGLFDANDRRLQWNDVLGSGDLFIQLIIERAPFATRELFRAETLKNSFLTRQTSFDSSVKTRDIDDRRAYLEPLSTDESWQAKYRITTAIASGDEHFSGLVYLCPSNDHPHYGIQYDIRLKDGTVLETSEVWMGAILLVGGVVLPPEGKLPLHEWFDFLPIPEISGQNSNDPALLGITPK